MPTISVNKNHGYWVLTGINPAMTDEQLSELLDEVLSWPDCPPVFLINGEIYTYSELSDDAVRALLLQ